MQVFFLAFLEGDAVFLISCNNFGSDWASFIFFIYTELKFVLYKEGKAVALIMKAQKRKLDKSHRTEH